MNIRVVIGAREGSVNLAHEFFPRILDPAITVGIRPDPAVWDGMSRLARRISHPQHDFWVRIADEADWQKRLEPGECLRVREDPASLSGERSRALYLFEGEFYRGGGKRAILGQFLPNGCTTSCHHHEHTTERFIPLLGMAYCRRRGTWDYLGCPLQIERGETHQLRACTDSFIVIIMDGPYGLSNDDHHYDEAIS